MSDPETGRYKIGSLSRITGLKPELLRAWQRRFSLFEPERTEGHQRLFTPDDLRIAVHVRDLLASGRSIGAVARRGRAELLSEARALHPELGNRALEPISFPPPARGPAPVPVTDPSEWRTLVDELVAGAIAIDPVRVTAALDRAFAHEPGEPVLSQLVEPAMQRIGDLWQRGECSVAGEHLVATAVRERLGMLIAASAPPVGGAAPEALVACAPDDPHENGALVVAARMVWGGWRVTWLGPALPIADLDKACRSIRPHAVYVSATLPDCFEAARPALLAFARRWRGAFELVVGGQGVPPEDPELTEAGARVSARWIPPARPEGWTPEG